MDFVRGIWNKAKRLNKTIVLPEAEDIRILKATELIHKGRLAKIILIGKEESIKKSADANDIDLAGAQIINPRNYKKLDGYVQILKEK